MANITSAVLNELYREQLLDQGCELIRAIQEKYHDSMFAFSRADLDLGIGAVRWTYYNVLAHYPRAHEDDLTCDPQWWPFGSIMILLDWWQFPSTKPLGLREFGVPIIHPLDWLVEDVELTRILALDGRPKGRRLHDDRRAANS